MEVLVNITSHVLATTISGHEESSLFDDSYNDIRIATENACFTFLAFPVCLFGIPANIVNCLVFWRQGLTDRMNLCLFSLALVDFLHLVCAFTMLPVSSLIRLHDRNLGEAYYVETMSMLLGVLYGCRSSSGFIGMVISIERCICVVRPLHAVNLIRTRSMGLVVLTSFFFFQICYVLYPLSLTSRCLTTIAHRQRCYLGTTQFQLRNSVIVGIIVYTLLDAVMPAFTFTVVVIMTIITVFNLTIAFKWRKQTTNITTSILRQQMALTSMLLGLSLVYVVTMSPILILQIINLSVPNAYLTSYNVMMASKALTLSAPTVNSSVNIVVYYSRSSRFRQTFRRMISPVQKHLSCPREAPRHVDKEAKAP